MQISFLGTGTSQGVPVIACTCAVCNSTNTKDKRLRSSVLISHKQKNISIDAGPDFRQQMLKHKVTSLEAVLFTHEHKDHTGGVDDLRSFNFIQQKAMPLYGLSRVLNQLKLDYAYAFSENKYEGSPDLTLHAVEAGEAFSLIELAILPLAIQHGKLDILGFRINDFAYISDASAISDETIAQLKGLKVLVLNALRFEKHHSHFTVSEAIAMANRIAPEKVYYTHLSHWVGKHSELSLLLPENHFVAYDGLVLIL